MLPARKEEVFPVEDDAKNDEGPIYTRVELRLTRLEDKVSVIATDVAELKSDVKDLRKEIGNAKIWALLITAVMIGVMARGFHWI
jgi:hypothetical protein